MDRKHGKAREAKHTLTLSSFAHVSFLKSSEQFFSKMSQSAAKKVHKVPRKGRENGREKSPGKMPKEH